MTTLDAVWLAQVAITGAMVGVIWTVQLVVYPQFLNVPPAAFGVYHRQHARRMSLVVIAPMLLEFGCALAQAWLVPGLWSCWGLGCVVVIWGLTFFGAVPLHGRLERGFDVFVIQRLIAVNAWRTAAWTARWAVLIVGWRFAVAH